MGEARSRRLALQRGQPLPEDLHRCPDCHGHRTAVEMAPSQIAMSHVPTLMGVCADCGAFWEAYPPGWKHDAVDGEPCDNCAFRPGSPESEDKAEWKSLLAKLRAGQEFKCHKGAPILLDKKTGAVEFDAAWVQRNGRTCVGFLRAMWKWGDWLENRYGVLHVLTKHDQEKLLGGAA